MESFTDDGHFSYEFDLCCHSIESLTPPSYPFLAEFARQGLSEITSSQEVYTEVYCPEMTKTSINIDNAYDESMTLWLLFPSFFYENEDGSLCSAHKLYWELEPGLWDDITENNWIARCVYLKFLGDFYDSPEIIG